MRGERASSEGEAMQTSGEDERALCEGEGECERRASEDEPAGAAAASGSTATTVGTYPSPKQPDRSVGQRIRRMRGTTRALGAHGQDEEWRRRLEGG
ncbi:hypothetical protein PC123_g10550 [Phytophthora cactorum]|nr:hypothetical protein PC123_g10550 [Phytophthora cactorum]